ncbi:pyridoxal-dependent decarboxylase, exosortase A system-associated [Aliiglaciecola sp. CAU 1673]|uniref:pyridoxal-dependent decarboxylase, exosortase A system-associated n=1 Tax=Aliiglaciecola sp. CAU 1673 TaxID=3032595 RepID=UPI0023DC76BE|nr:pyridoxal-dependent decarboxylase, exosortase A system-associated [Aliiglaciecola sp. CAU 1673]MDF2177314.1 pyridoxal-dependent decarboxylase, exosortase A system-associated [Aliiglaciecola sp. CAU 1673]
MNKPQVQHENMDQFAQHNGRLLVGGKNLDEISGLLGKEVFYAYERRVIDARIEQFKAFIPAPIKLHFAIKANPYPPLVHYVASKVDGLDVASQKELLIALQSGADNRHISFAGPSKSEAEIKAAILAGVTLNVESELELKRCLDLGRQLGHLPRVAFRVNPAFELKASGMKMAGGAKQFGIDEERLMEILPTLDFNRLDFQGFHIFCGSQNLKAEALIEAHNQTFHLAERLVECCPAPVKSINLGGGFGIPYFPGERRLDLAPIGENLKALLEATSIDLAKTELVIELGRFLVAEAGIYACKVTDIKESRGQTFLMTNGGLHHHLSNSGNFGQVIRKNYPVALADKLDQDATRQVNVAGPLCTPLDSLADKVWLPEAQLGDWFVVYQSGAYGPTASPQDFLGHPHVVEILL